MRLALVYEVLKAVEVHVSLGCLPLCILFCSDIWSMVTLDNMFDTAVFRALIYFFLQARGTMKRKEVQKILTHHLYFCMRDFGHHVGEDTEIYFSLYDTKKAKYIR